MEQQVCSSELDLPFLLIQRRGGNHVAPFESLPATEKILVWELITNLLGGCGQLLIYCQYFPLQVFFTINIMEEHQAQKRKIICYHQYCVVIA